MPTTALAREQRIQYKEKNNLSFQNKRNIARTKDSEHYKERTSGKDNNVRRKSKYFTGKNRLIF